MSEPRAKRPKITRGEDDYLPGNITEIKLHNFMTFNDLNCKPGSRLNLVIGPNGSGKSSLVCVIALGLGCEPQFLPQNRVCEFAKVSLVQLLEETEKAVGDPQLPVQHRALVDKSGELKRLECAVEQNGIILNQLKALNAEQEKYVERVREREELLAKEAKGGESSAVQDANCKKVISLINDNAKRRMELIKNENLLVPLKILLLLN